MIIGYLDEMVKAAAGRPVFLVNPLLYDRPSSNNLMQIRGRAERQEISDSFQDVFVLRLVYPSSGGYMFPIRGMVSKKDFHAPWVLYNKDEENGREVYNVIASLDPYIVPDATLISDIFRQNPV